VQCAQMIETVRGAGYRLTHQIDATVPPPAQMSPA
jgi:hypothetical protein